ncbi:NmrA family NAD(P)-binding protein (plasmid) [Polymorphobacter sp. PAMC 29334]|uniref:NmrA family NAD(P)-binding protein n=1 Tax=Polymorphobacter sp. PAMC 29334 TaxID=2862331 RepID=UPI001C75ECEC|nr:NmrA family NAD(P)-binding protein [Polymorphobacter sp. PAMC 29334]QYE33061.1 NmrA family NAD(P)-binding protein [Polymorphobacter sp. PAMC 29334]
MSNIGPIVLAGATGDLGKRIAVAMGRRHMAFRVLIRSETPAKARADLQATGADLVVVDYNDAAALRRACEGASCIVSALNGLEPVMIETQGNLLDAAVATGVPRFIPSDYSLDFTKTKPGGNRNLDLRRRFMAQIDTRPISATSVLNGAFADLLTWQAPIVLHKQRKILYWGTADQKLDFTAKNDVADYVAAATLDETTPRILRIAGTTVSPRELADIMTSLTGHKFGLWRAGGIGLLSIVIGVARTLSPSNRAIFPVWQGMQYLRDMSSGRGQLEPLDNDRYGVRSWKTARDVLGMTN